MSAFNTSQTADFPGLQAPRSQAASLKIQDKPSWYFSLNDNDLRFPRV